ncbi:MAG: rRNA maturation RNase YbeY [Rhodobacteraceae bacterium]|nr:rRNA maturation RNase YbeY [Paracoccaceae bacterium]
MPEPLADLVIEDESWQALDLGQLAEQSFRAALAGAGIAPEGYEIALLACDDVRIADLNREFRDKPAATNVLSWPVEDLAPDSDGGIPVPPPRPDGPFAESLGDIAIAYGTCRAEAEAAGIAFDDHVSHLLVHGCLHLLGYDHVRDKDATRMEALEVAILAKLGIANPY